MSDSNSITVELGAERALLDRFLASGEYSSPSEVLRAAVRALDRQEVAAMREMIDDAFADPAPDIPADEVIRELRDHHEQRWAKAPNEL